MADAALLAAGGADAPLSYVVPGATAIRIKQIHVAYKDNGAGGTWLPAVRIVSDSSHTMGTAADQGVTVTAGSDADVSFFPGVKPAAAAATAGSGVPWAYTKSDPAGQSIGSGLGPVYFSVHDTGGSDRFETADASIFANASTSLFTGSPVWGIQINAPGTYMVQGTGFWTSQGTTGRGIHHYYSASNGSAPSVFQLGRTDALTGDNWSHAGPAPGNPHLSYYEFISVASGQLGAVLVGYAQVDSGGASVVHSDMMIFQISTYVAAEL